MKNKPTRRQTKVLPLLNFTGEPSDVTLCEDDKKITPQFKIAPAGSKVDMPLKSDRPADNVDEEEEVLEEAVEIQQLEEIDKAENTENQKEDCKSPNAKYEMPPRFQAAKLKHALSGALGSTRYVFEQSFILLN